MSEVNDAVQIVLVMGKAGYCLGNITVKMALSVLKLLNTLYMAKWNGRVSLQRLRNIKGDDFLFINVTTEQKAVLENVEKEMREHGILFAKMPDLCGGDGRTQYAIATTDAVKMKSFLLDHKEGAWKDIRVGPISAADYAKTGEDVWGNKTEEAKQLEIMANEDKQYERFMQDMIKEGNPLPFTDETLSHFFEVYNDLQVHDRNVTGDAETFAWIEEEPLYADNQWSIYMLPNGEHAVVVSNEDIKQSFQEVEGAVVKKSKAFIQAEKNYVLVDLKTKKQSMDKGTAVLRMLKETNIFKENQGLKNLHKNLLQAGLVKRKKTDKTL